MLLRLMIAIALALAGSLACGDDTAPADAGLDAGRDGGPDAGERRDAGRDGGLDAGGEPDAGDGGVDPAGWVPLPGLPEGCVIERAEHPEVLFTPEWESCGDGCERLALEPARQRAFGSDAGAHDGDTGYFTLIRGGALGEHRIVVVGRTEGPPIAGWRSIVIEGGSVCDLDPVALHSTHAAAATRVYDEMRPRFDAIYHAPLAMIGAATEPVAVLDAMWLPGGNVIQNLATSDTTVAGEVQLAGYIAVAEDGALYRLIDASSAVRGIPQNVHVVGRWVYWGDYDAPRRIARGSATVAPEVYLERPGADMMGMRIDGEWVAWQEGPAGGPYTAMELWAAPYAEDPSALSPRRVRALGGFSSQSTLGAGVYAVMSSSVQIDLYDLTDGRKRTYRAPAGVGMTAPLYVTADEMLVPATYPGERRTLLRIALASLPYE